MTLAVEAWILKSLDRQGSSYSQLLIPVFFQVILSSAFGS